MADLPLSATQCNCDETSCQTCPEGCIGTLECCNKPQACVKERDCTIKPIYGEVCEEPSTAGEYEEEQYFDALLVDEGCKRLIVTEDCKPIYGTFNI